MRIATGADAHLLGGIVGEAFRDDPVSLWCLGSPAVIRATFTILGQSLYLPRGHCCILDDQAATMWLWPNQEKALPLTAQLKIAGHVLSNVSPRHLQRTLALDAVMVRYRPREPHMYLFAVGVASSARGKGLGGEVIREGLALADAMGVPAYLENSNPANTGLYQRLGFKALETFRARPGCPPLVAMMRQRP